MSKEKEVGLNHITNDDKDTEDLNGEVDKMLKAVLDNISSASMGPPPVIEKSSLDTQGSLVSRSRFLAFYKEHKSKFDKFMEFYLRPGIYRMKEMIPTFFPLPIATLDDEQLFRIYKNFKKFDIASNLSDHLFSALPVVKPSKLWAERIKEEWRILAEKLPDTENIFVRAYESRMDLLRAVIVGAKGTPYHDGLFFFDVYFPPMYPYQPPLLRYRTGGFGGINPHVLMCGQVRLNLFDAQSLDDEILWLPFSTTMLQLLVSIHDRVLNATPLFHQPGILESGSSVVAEYFSILYNEKILIKSLKTMTYTMCEPPKNFEDFVVGHFRYRVRDILMACKYYINGGQAGCDVSGVGNKESCYSPEFQNSVALCMMVLKVAFKLIGATEANNFQLLLEPTSELIKSNPSFLENPCVHKAEFPCLSASSQV